MGRRCSNKWKYGEKIWLIFKVCFKFIFKILSNIIPIKKQTNINIKDPQSQYELDPPLVELPIDNHYLRIKHLSVTQKRKQHHLLELLLQPLF